MRIGKDTTLEEVAFIVSDALIKHGITATLSGGGAVTIYTENRYVSGDLDFVSAAGVERLEAVMKSLGFTREGRHFTHSETEFSVEFPPSPVMLGSQMSKEEFYLEREKKRLRILSPTESVMDRLAGFFAWRDRQNFKQALMIAEQHDVNLNKIARWAKAEGFEEEHKIFVEALKDQAVKGRGR
jgi:hypothetical protein